MCDYVCANENPDLKIHMQRRHAETSSSGDTQTLFECQECGILVGNKKDLRQHLKYHKKGPELKLFCETCSFVTDCESRLRRHVFTHTNEKPYQCGACDYRASQKEHVVRHMKSKHDIDARVPVSKQEMEKPVDENSNSESTDSKDDSVSNKNEKADFSCLEKIFACNHCQMKFAKLLNLYKHLHAQHKSVLPDQADDEYLCVVCDFRTMNKKNLLVHMRKHNMHDHSPPTHVYSCVLCRYMNPKRKNLFQHMKKKHNIEIVMKEDGTSSCFVADNSASTSNTDINEAVSSLLGGGVEVGNSSEESQLQIITEDDFVAKGGIQIQNIISMEELAIAVSRPTPNTTLSQWKKNVTEGTEDDSATVHSDAVEAIEGLKALAEQAEKDSELQKTILKEMENSQIVDDMETEIITMDTTSADIVEPPLEKNDIQLSAEEIADLSSGDFVQIDGEMYKVEIATDEHGESKVTLPGRIESKVITEHSDFEKTQPIQTEQTSRLRGILTGNEIQNDAENKLFMDIQTPHSIRDENLDHIGHQSSSLLTDSNVISESLEIADGNSYIMKSFIGDITKMEKETISVNQEPQILIGNADNESFNIENTMIQHSAFLEQFHKSAVSQGNDMTNQNHVYIMKSEGESGSLTEESQVQELLTQGHGTSGESSFIVLGSPDGQNIQFDTAGLINQAEVDMETEDGGDVEYQVIGEGQQTSLNIDTGDGQTEEYVLVGVTASELEDGDPDVATITHV